MEYFNAYELLEYIMIALRYPGAGARNIQLKNSGVERRISPEYSIANLFAKTCWFCQTATVMTQHLCRHRHFQWPSELDLIWSIYRLIMHDMEHIPFNHASKLALSRQSNWLLCFI